MINHLVSVPNTASSGASTLVQGLMKQADLNRDGQVTTAEFTRFLQDAIDEASLSSAAGGGKAAPSGDATPVPPAKAEAPPCVARIKS